MAHSDRGTSAILAALGLIALVFTAQFIGAGSSIAAPTPSLPANMGADPAGYYPAPDPAAAPQATTPPAQTGNGAPTAKPTGRAGTSSSRGGGGITITPNPRIDDVRCVKQCVSPRRATPGATVRITGAYLDQIRRVVFPGKKKRMVVRWKARKYNAVRVEVPRGADDGRPWVSNGGGVRSNRAPRDLLIVPKTRIPKEVFPVQGSYSYGGAGGRFGAGRPGHIHQGQDLSASCGTKLVAVKRSTVVNNDYHSAAGNYVVLKNRGENTYFVYMHMVRPSRMKVGTDLAAGAPVGRVGTTGSSSGCHLHFEYWVGPWQTGGKPIDPLPYLRSL